MNHKKSGYKVSQQDSAYYRQHSSKGRVIEVWADIIKPVDEPEFAEECEYKLAKITSLGDSDDHFPQIWSSFSSVVVPIQRL